MEVDKDKLEFALKFAQSVKDNPGAWEGTELGQCILMLSEAVCALLFATDFELVELRCPPPGNINVGALAIIQRVKSP